MTMILKMRTVLDDGFLVGLVFALFLAGRIVPYLILVGVVPIVLFWAKSDYTKSSTVLTRFLLPTMGYFAFCLLLLYAYPGLQPDQEPPNNPNLELYTVAIALLAAGFLRGQQIKNISARFQTIVPLSLLAAFAVLSTYMFLGIDGCRVKVAASWPFIPAIIFATLTFLLLLGWEGRTVPQRYFRLLLISLSIVVTLAYTGSRGIAIGQFAVLAALALLRCVVKYRSGLPKLRELAAAVTAGLVLCVLVGVSTGCSGFNRWPALLEVVNLRTAGHIQLLSKPELEARAGETASEIVAKPAPAVARKSTAVIIKDPSIALRLDMWTVSWEAIRQAPVLGHGALSLRPIIEEKFGFEHNHNQYLAWLVTGGVVFLIIGLCFLSTPVLVSKVLAPVDRALFFCQ
ncbi:O-antigen ligase family protein [Shinella fusca]|uniref:O-antigen ligase n=1 Tax=Shinella fusca TaxID=544480 RepID=A0A7W7YRU3_9HYPH|nr:O-antigen ligase family protein [Shinella fusca]MBB5041092.1 O-antigen ligase [Shinella fusca]